MVITVLSFVLYIITNMIINVMNMNNFALHVHVLDLIIAKGEKDVLIPTNYLTEKITGILLWKTK